MNTKRLISFILALICSFPAMGFNLGDAYSSATGVPLGKSCLEIGNKWPEYMQVSNSRAVLNFKQVTDYEQLKDLLSVTGKINFSNTLISAEAEGKYLDSMDKSSRTTHIIYKIDASSDVRLNMDFDKYNPITNGLSSGVRDLYTSGKEEDHQNFFANCGDSYVGSAKMTGGLLVDVSIKFQNSAARESFEATVAGEIKKPSMSLGVSAALELAKNNTNGTAEISISALQLGGGMLNIAQLIHKDENGKYAVSQCGGASGDAGCGEIMTSVLEYGEHLIDQYTKNSDYYYTDPVPVTYASTFRKPGNPEAEANEAILSRIQDGYEELKETEAIIQEFKARIGEGNKSSEGYKTLEAYNKTVIQPYLTVYRESKELKKCAQSLTNKDCVGIEKIIQNNKNKKALNSKGNISSDFTLANSRGEKMLNFIRDNNYTVRLLTLKDLSYETPKFQGVACNLTPEYQPDLPNSLVLSCPKTATGAEVTDLPEEGINLKVGSDKKLSFDGFVYAVIEGRDKYCFKYPGTVNGAIPPSEPGAYMIKDPEIMYHHQINQKDAKGHTMPCPDADDEEAWTPVTQANASKLSGRFSFVQQTLVSIYPNIIH
ncbi:MAG: hypothetical protein K0R14_1545 [Burkholderiales bacterium]|jgi:hypothetical protein|nr:hypothetical protein [Burkholderiales bacterium]